LAMSIAFLAVMLKILIGRTSLIFVKTL
jgi:hypothetical protein